MSAAGTSSKKPELLSPAGHWPQLRAAIEAGADAVYFGLNHFTARAKVGFSLAELPEAMDELHERGVKGFVTLNTLVFDHEIDEAAKGIEAIAAAGCDAVLVQDVGVAGLVRSVAPGLDLHGSTQMSITSAEGAELARELGCSRVVLGRELSLKDVRQIAAQTDVELETFVHGALCVSYSGQCFSSEAWGGRSANRGQCAQACRLAYDLIVDGQKKELGEYRYLLSPGDLYALEQIPELIEIGVACFKIEGRYKSPEYVALTTRAYRAAIDAAIENRAEPVPKSTRNELEQVYSRGLGSHFIAGIDHQKVVVGRAPRHRGVKAGVVSDVLPHCVTVRLEPDLKLKPGDGIVFDAAQRRSPAEKEEGGFLFEVNELTKDEVELIFGRDSVDLSLVKAGDWVWRTTDPQLMKKIKLVAHPQQVVFTRPIEFSVVANSGEPLRVEARCDDDSIRVEFQSSEPLTEADKHAISIEKVQEQLGRLGGTPFHVGDVDFSTDGSTFVPVSLLNEARRELVEAVLDQRTQLKEIATDRSVNTVDPYAISKTEPAELHLHVLVRNSEQLSAAIECRPASITLDYLELYGLRSSVERVRDAGIVARVASPRVLKPSEEKVVRFLLSLKCEIVVRSGGLLYQLTKKDRSELPRLIGDFSLNVANQLSCQKMFELGVACVTPTHDLNGQQISELARVTDSDRIEVVAFHHLPVFHTEHCVFCRFLSTGTDSSNCGHPCESHQIALADAQGRQHPVLADVGCRNTVFGAEAQFGGRFMNDWRESGISNYRIEFVHETAEQILAITKGFQQFLSRKIDTDALVNEINQHAQTGTTDGSLFVPQDFKRLVQLS